MTSLRARLLSLRQENSDSQKFVPEGDLQALFSKNVIQKCISNCGIKHYKRAEAISMIMDGAQKIFATLVLINQEAAITKFIQNDQFQHSRLDSKLPFSLPDLESMGFDWAQDFYETQWEFISPVFPDRATHRILD